MVHIEHEPSPRLPRPLRREGGDTPQGRGGEPTFQLAQDPPTPFTPCHAGRDPLKISDRLEIWRQLQSSEADRKIHSLIMTPGEESTPERDQRREQIRQDYKDTVFLPQLYRDPPIAGCMGPLTYP